MDILHRNSTRHLQVSACSRMRPRNSIQASANPTEPSRWRERRDIDACCDRLAEIVCTRLPVAKLCLVYMYQGAVTRGYPYKPVATLRCGTHDANPRTRTLYDQKLRLRASSHQESELPDSSSSAIQKRVQARDVEMLPSNPESNPVTARRV